MRTRHFPILLTALVSVAAATDVGDLDQRIETAARTSYNLKAILDEKVNVDAEDGVVTLTGTVDLKDQKMLAEETVRDLPGVTAVKNDIVVAREPEAKSDGWIALKIRSLLMVRANVSATGTKVQVKDGIVTLTGIADSDLQKQLTETYVREVEGIRSIRNEMVVRTSPTPAGTRTLADVIDDASITAQVKRRLLANHSQSAPRTTITTRAGTVSITGKADSNAEKELISELARQVRGVVAVDNTMAVAR